MGKGKGGPRDLGFQNCLFIVLTPSGSFPPTPPPTGLEGAILGSWSPHLLAALGKEAMPRSSEPAVLFLTQIRERDVARVASCHGNTN